MTYVKLKKKRGSFLLGLIDKQIYVPLHIHTLWKVGL